MIKAFKLDFSFKKKNLLFMSWCILKGRSNSFSKFQRKAMKLKRCYAYIKFGKFLISVKNTIQVSNKKFRQNI